MFRELGRSVEGSTTEKKFIKIYIYIKYIYFIFMKHKIYTNLLNFLKIRRIKLLNLLWRFSKMAPESSRGTWSAACTSVLPQRGFNNKKQKVRRGEKKRLLFAEIGEKVSACFLPVFSPILRVVRTGFFTHPFPQSMCLPPFSNQAFQTFKLMSEYK